MSAIHAANPSLLVADVVKAAAYYTDKLGFAVNRFGHLLAFGHAIAGADNG